MSDDLLKDPLPEPWTFGVTKDGRVFFINDDEKRTTWLHPDTGQPAMTGFHRFSDLPNGWEQGFSQDGHVYYIDHATQTTTFQDPRIAESDDQQKEMKLKKKKRRSSFTETLTRPIFRRSSSKSRSKPEKMHVREKRRSSVKRSNSVGSHKGIKMTVVRRDPNSVVTRSGWLYKQDSSGVGGMKIWRKRWFVLSDFCLFYYKDSKEEEVLGSIVLPSYIVNTVIPDDKINRKYAFKIEHPGMRTYYICAESYNDMAQWVTELTRLCTFNANQSGSRKSLDSKENTRLTDEEQAFGFNEPRRQSKTSVRGSSSSTPQSIKKDSSPVVNGKNNAKISTSSSAPSSRGPRNSNSRIPRSSSASNHTQNSSLSSGSNKPRRQNSAPPPKHPGMEQKHSATRHSRPNQKKEYYSDASTPENRRHRTNNDVGRSSSMMKLGNWVQTQKMKQQYHTINSRNVYYPSGPRPGQPRAPSSGKRYKPGTYSDYMDSTEVASSIMSVPPMYRNKVVSLPRPRSSQDVDNERSRRKKIANSKSVGYISPDYHKTPFQTKSEYSLSPNQQTSATSKSPNSADSARRGYDDVFSPVNNNIPDQRRFKYESASTHRTPSFHAAISPTTTSSYEVKQVDVQGKQGQLRAFAISSRVPSAGQTVTRHNQPPSNKENKNNSEGQIENKLKRLNELDKTLQKLSHEIENLQNDKRILEQSLNKAKSTHAFGTGSELELEQKLTRVKSKLAKSSQKLKEMTTENEEFEKDIKKLKMKLLEQLNKKINSKSNQRQLEWELGRVQLIMEGVNKNKTGLANRLHSFEDESFESDLSLPNSARSGSNKKLSSTMPRSPRDVKRHSNERHSSGGSPYARAPSSSSSLSQESKFFTLPGRGVSRATSVDSLTASAIARFTRPSSARSANNLHRTKSAAERLLSGSHSNLGAVQDPDEVKKIQREINLSRLRTLSGEATRKPSSTRSYLPNTSAHMQVGIDVQMAIKNHRMPKVLQRAKRDMQRAEAERRPVKPDHEIGFDIDRLEADATDEHDAVGNVTHDDDFGLGVTELDVEPEDVQVDLNLSHQLIAPDKVEIPDRLLEYEDVELTPEQERLKQKKIRAIESMLTRSGQTASQPTVHLAAALAAEAGSVARAVAYQAQQNKDLHPSLV